MSKITPRPTHRGIFIGDRRDVALVNPIDRSWTRHRYVLWFGAYGDTRLMVWANSLNDAFDECIDWIVDHAPGLLCDDKVAERYQECIDEKMSEEEAIEEAEEDTCSGGNAGNRINSWEWGIVFEDPTREELEAYLNDTRKRLPLVHTDSTNGKVLADAIFDWFAPFAAAELAA